MAKKLSAPIVFDYVDAILEKSAMYKSWLTAASEKLEFIHFMSLSVLSLMDQWNLQKSAIECFEVLS